MTDASQERGPDEVMTSTAQVLPFERPHNALQRAVQIRAQEQMERQRHKPKIGPVRLFLTLVVAFLPVLVLLGAADAFVRGIHLLTNLHAAKEPARQTASQDQQPASPTQQPGVVLLVPPQSPEQQGPEVSPPNERPAAAH